MGRGDAVSEGAERGDAVSVGAERGDAVSVGYILRKLNDSFLRKHPTETAGSQ